jgi:5-deoxy-glucuronate isomerase
VTRDLVIRAGSSTSDSFVLSVTPESAGWTYSGLHIAEVAPDSSVSFAFEDDEVLLVPLSGGVRVWVDGTATTLQGRRSVFDGSTDRMYLPPGVPVRLEWPLPSTPPGGQAAAPQARSRIAVCTARSDGAAYLARYLAADHVNSAARGTGSISRQVVDLANSALCPAERLLVCEVYTPAGNTSSTPPHKHDTATADETELEEIYYFELSGPGAARHCTSASDARPIDVDAEVGTGDVALVPFGWHGPTAAPADAHLYYLNVMAGPVRDWRVTFHPTAGPLPDPGAPIDPRLPLVPIGRSVPPRSDAAQQDSNQPGGDHR